MQTNTYQLQEENFPIQDFENLICFEGNEFDISPVSTDLIAALYQSSFNSYNQEKLLIEKRILIYLKKLGIHMKTDPRKKEYEYKNKSQNNCVIQLIKGTQIYQKDEDEVEIEEQKQINNHNLTSQSLKMNPLLLRRKKQT